MRTRHRINAGGRRAAVALTAAALLTPLHPASAADRSPAVDRSPTAQARALGHQVELTDRHTESSRTFANPDGSFTYQSYAQPQWVKHGSSWVSLDATLQRSAGGGYSPAASTSPLVLSGGGIGPLATMTVDGHRLSLTWPHPLPAPVVSGTVATYANVLASGVDLQVSATPAGGIQEALVVKNATAAADPALAALTLATETDPGLALTADAGGNVAVKDTTGRALFTAPAPMMWDSRSSAAGTPAHPAARAESATSSPSTAGTSGEASTVHGPGLGAKVAPIHVTVHGGDLALVPDHALLTDSHAAFPFFVDPSFTPHPASAGTLAYDEIQQAYPDAAGLNSGTSLAVGYQGWQAPYGVDRTFYRLGVPSAIYDAHVLSATVGVTEIFASSCSTTSRVDAYFSGAIWAGTTWNNAPGLMQQQGSVWFSPTCGGGSTAGSYDFTNTISQAAANHWADMTFGLVNGDETNQMNFVRFSPNAYLSVTYNHLPSVPGSLAVSPATTSNGTTYTTSGQPTFSATSTDSDGDTVRLDYQVLAGTTLKASGSSAFVNSGSSAAWQPGTALADGAYTWQVRAYDGLDYSAWSAPQNLTVSTIPPAAPTVSDPDYPAGTWTTPASGPSTFTFADTSSGVTGYRYRLDGAAGYTTIAGNTVQLSPAPGWHTLAVAAVNASGAVSTTTGYSFGAGTAVVTSPADGSNGTGAAVGLTATSAPGLTSVRFQYHTGTVGGYTDIPVGDVTSAGAPIGSWPVATGADGSSPSLVWNAANSVATDCTLQVQAVFTDAAGRTVVSAPVSYAMVHPTPPSAPSPVTATPLNGGATVTWALPATGAATVTGYTVTVSLGGFTVGTPVSVPAGTLSTTVSGLNNGATYNISVTASNAYGPGPAATTTVIPAAS